MNKAWLIIKREYLYRIRKRSFLLMTILGPVFFALLLIIPTWLSLTKLESQKVIMVLDQNGILNQEFVQEENLVLKKLPQVTSQEKAFVIFSSSEAGSLLIIPEAGRAFIYVKEPLSPGVLAWTKNKLNEGYIKSYLENKGFPEEESRSVSKGVEIDVQKLYTDDSSEQEAIAGISILLGIVIYLFILTYTMQVMRGVVEEKTSRVVEVLLTSVNSFKLMLGKILGIGLVSITQFTIWLSLAFLITGAFTLRYGESLKLFNNKNISETIQTEGVDIQQALEWNQIINTFNAIDLTTVFICFAFYFIFGYLFYSSIFAAIGASVDSETDTQQFVFPLTVPILICFTLVQTFVNAPEGSISLFFSLFPLTSPIAVMILLPYNIPNWQLFLSMAILLVSFLLMVWVAGKVYRVGILMYGKKASLKEMFKWISKP